MKADKKDFLSDEMKYFFKSLRMDGQNFCKILVITFPNFESLEIWICPKHVSRSVINFQEELVNEKLVSVRKATLQEIFYKRPIVVSIAIDSIIFNIIPLYFNKRSKK